MRLDKFLKVSRLVKRRTVANELCDGGRVQMDGKIAKASSEVKAGSRLQLRFGNRVMAVEVLRVPEKAVPVQEAATLYQVLSEETADSPAL